MNRINLMPKVRKLAREKRVRCRAWYLICGVYTALLIVVCLSICGVRIEGDMRTLTSELAQLDSELSELDTAQAAIRPELVKSRFILSSSKSIADQPDWSVMLAYLANELLGDQVVLRGCSMNPVGGGSGAKESEDVPIALTLTGYAKSTPAASQFVLRIEQSGLFDRVTLTRTQMESFLDGQAIAFEVRCVVGEEGGG